ncbi:GDSL-type esterase/lipase family protein [Algoriphagus sp.]|uniref:SGNH/GDSL hydrolase family protein n=1 Tax=Algoriphagus sp. TaxID=1872435 RepID=UPI0026392369|nr:GDSL-type esterase/lipase family protein [Algoriphagus sp.]
MIATLFIPFLLTLVFACGTPQSNSSIAPEDMQDRPLTYLALGDSYTIGEGVSEAERYPNQLVRQLNASMERTWSEPEIIAKTGWTVEELEEGILDAAPTGEPYNLVTLLIGVNNQYRGRSVEEFESEFEQMLLRAIGFAGNLPNHVFVLSIPDWGVTPFAAEKGSDIDQVKSQIDAFNAAKKEVCRKYGVAFIEITEQYRQIGGLPEMVVEDQLHPSGLVYSQWTDKLLQEVLKIYQN